MSSFKKDNYLYEIESTNALNLGLYRTKAMTVYILVNNFMLGAKRLDTKGNTTGDYLYYLVRCKNKSKNTGSEWLEISKQEGENLINSKP